MYLLHGAGGRVAAGAAHAGLQDAAGEGEGGAGQGHQGEYRAPRGQGASASCMILVVHDGYSWSSKNDGSYRCIREYIGI